MRLLRFHKARIYTEGRISRARKSPRARAYLYSCGEILLFDQVEYKDEVARARALARRRKRDRYR